MSENSHWQDFQLIQLSNQNGVKVDVSDLGASIVNFLVPVKGREINIVLGYDSAEEYLQGECFFGAVIGPWANRIADGRFLLNGQEIQLDQNEGTNHLHGGCAEIHKKKWQAAVLNSNSVAFSIDVTEGTAGYPASARFSVIYTLNDNDELKIEYGAEVDNPMPVNLTQHTYFNLNGAGSTLDHSMQILGSHFLSVDKQLIPDQEMDVEGTGMDFRTPKTIGADLQKQEEQINLAKGFDHCWCLDNDLQADPALSVRVDSDVSGIAMEVYTNQPGIQFYSGSYLDNEKGRDGQVYQPYNGFCLETQLYPDQVNMDIADQCILQPGQAYRHKTIYKIISGQ